MRTESVAFKFQKVSDYGMSTPVVARTLPQAGQLMQGFGLSERVKEAVSEAEFGLQRHLVRCLGESQRVKSAVQAGVDAVDQDGIDVQSGGRAFGLPSVPDLEARAESFLQAAKLAIRQVGKILQAFSEETFDHRFDQILAWARKQHPPGHNFVSWAEHYGPLAHRVVEMRNAVDHPALGRTLTIQNFDLGLNAGVASITPPTWSISGEQPAPIVEDMDQIIEGILRASEDLLISCLFERREDRPITFEEIPEDERRPEFPMRYRLALG